MKRVLVCVLALTAMCFGQAPVNPATLPVAGLVYGPDPRGYLLVQSDPSPLIFEDFGAALNTSTKWNATAGGTGTAPSSSADSAGAALNAGATLNGFSALSSINTYSPSEPGFLRLEWRNNLTSNTSTTTYNFWGVANLPATPTIANPVVDGCGFDVLQGTAKLMAVCYQGTGGTTGARVVITDLSATTGNGTQPANLAAVHKYDLLFSGALAYWLIDGQVVASMLNGANGPNSNTVSLTSVSISNGGTANPLNVNGVVLGDTTSRQTNICDISATWICLKLTSAASLSQASNINAILSEKGSRWQVNSAPAVSTQATATKAAGAASVRHVADCVTVSAGAATAPTATVLTINLRDGATGAGTVIWTTQITAAATAAQHGNVAFCGLNLIGTAATAMTLEFSALLTSENEAVSLTGFDVQ